MINATSEIIFHVTMKLEDGSAADSTKVNNKPAKLRMGDGSLSPAFEAELQGLAAGDTKEFTLYAKDAFGEMNPDNIYHLERSRFEAESLEVGAIIAFEQQNGTELPGVIREIVGDSVTIDFNHPLAGQTITFDVEIIEVNA
ncbi:FKBP-type peptidyl-prolyl cis-trans isomerase [Psychrobium sp. 1_MG-2023]|uniref:FKBP-type peptidyl-prolyl cis-trans isomerase n=1 Tax=Psychrobium sp. 1_MG-2023 TaxID=3062624 RepID=UPI000C3223FE|nr:FKBP-type peptidyl-prolyl cis-trans isomerase [Psychrobium sp. 1_MG-2023]MDP2561321.1 FKBP-type peptidyl-prolyl cis-trans isomerase [Psychrobium sp. 1_MG-2023]PKF54135.1 peptidylprolyl isomerase [Alteromonadales bacterium alter-6D02]